MIQILSYIIVAVSSICLINYHINRLLKSMVTTEIPISFDSLSDWLLGIRKNKHLRSINILLFIIFVGLGIKLFVHII